MTEYKFYNEWNGPRYLQLHDHHTMWNINKDFSFNEYCDEVTMARWNMENYFKDLKMYYLGRSGRHVCVDDTPTNRRRYKQLVAYAEKLEQGIIDYFNSDDNEFDIERGR